MTKAIWNGVVLAESAHTEIVEGNHYFPPQSLNHQYFADNPQQTVCHWKGTAGYFDIVVDGKVNKGAAWTYPQPKPAASNIKEHVAFWRGVQIES